MGGKDARAREARHDYLRAIYESDDGKGVRAVVISKKLKISKASVSEMLKKLASKKLVKMRRYSKVFLTSKGKDEAKKAYEKHSTISEFIIRIMRLEEAKAREEAHSLEHAFSDDAVDSIKNILGRKEIKVEELPSYVG